MEIKVGDKVQIVSCGELKTIEVTDILKYGGKVKIRTRHGGPVLGFNYDYYPEDLARDIKDAEYFSGREHLESIKI